MNTFLHFALFAALLIAGVAEAAELSAERIGEIVGAKATTTPDGVVRVGWPRTDVQVVVDGVSLRPFAGLGSWAAFQQSEHGTMVMGDTVVFQDEVNPAMDAAFTGGLEVTALHNHFFFDEPKVYFMHIGGQGEPEKLGAAGQGVWGTHVYGRPGGDRPAQPLLFRRAQGLLHAHRRPGRAREAGRRRQGRLGHPRLRAAWR